MKKNKILKVLMAVLILGMILSFCGCSGEEEKVSDNFEETNTAPTIEKGSGIWESSEYPNHTFREESLDNMLEILRKNPLKAEAEYLESYIKFTGYESLSTHSSNNELSDLGTTFMVQETLPSKHVFSLFSVLFFPSRPSPSLYPKFPHGPHRYAKHHLTFSSHFIISAYSLFR